MHWATTLTNQKMLNGNTTNLMIKEIEQKPTMCSKGLERKSSLLKSRQSEVAYTITAHNWPAYFGNRQNVRFAVLTDGINYQFFTDLTDAKTMDKEPFMDIHLELLYDWHISALRAFTKSEFDLNKATSVAIIVKYIGEMQRPPSNSIIEEYFSEVGSGRLLLKTETEFESLVISATSKTGVKSAAENGQPKTFGSDTKDSIASPVLIPVFADHRGQRFWAKFVVKRKYQQRGDRVVRLTVTWHDLLFETRTEGYYSVSESAQMVTRHIKKNLDGQIGNFRGSNKGWKNFWYFIDKETDNKRPIDDFRNDPRLVNRYLRRRKS